MTFRALYEQAVQLHQKGNLAEAEKIYARILAAQPPELPPAMAGNYVRVMSNHADTLYGLGRPGEALTRYDQALAIKPDFLEAIYYRGTVLQNLNRFEEALASYDQALAIKPDLVDALCNRGIVLHVLNRFAEALRDYDQTLALSPDFLRALVNRGTLLMAMQRQGDALADYDRAIAIAPDHVDALFNRASLLWDMGQPAAAADSYVRVLAVKPDAADALYNLGKVLCETDRVPEGMAAFRRHAQMVYGDPVSARARDAVEPNPPHKQRHDREQRDYLAGLGTGAAFHMEEGARLAGPAINPRNGAGIAAQWQSNNPQIVVIDDFLTQEALEKLRLYCWGSTMWRKVHTGYLSALPENGLASPLLGQIADEMREIFPTIFGAHPLLFFWGFKYDSTLPGIDVHADFAAVNVNFWITPDEANLDPGSGGLKVWDVAAPAEWNFDQYNQKAPQIRKFLEGAGARPRVIPHRANRAVIFDSDLFHETDTIMFKDGYLNRRINLTLLYGRR